MIGDMNPSQRVDASIDERGCLHGGMELENTGVWISITTLIL